MDLDAIVGSELGGREMNLAPLVDRHLLELQPDWRGIAVLTAAQAVGWIGG